MASKNSLVEEFVTVKEIIVGHILLSFRFILKNYNTWHLYINYIYHYWNFAAMQQWWDLFILHYLFFICYTLCHHCLYAILIASLCHYLAGLCCEQASNCKVLMWHTANGPTQQKNQQKKKQAEMLCWAVRGYSDLKYEWGRERDREGEKNRWEQDCWNMLLNWLCDIECTVLLVWGACDLQQWDHWSGEWR